MSRERRQQAAVGQGKCQLLNLGLLRLINAGAPAFGGRGCPRGYCWSYISAHTM